MINQSLEEATEQSTTVTSSKSFQYCVNPSSSDQFLYFPAIQLHSGDNAVDLASQGAVLLPKGFTEYMHHVGNASEVNP